MMRLIDFVWMWSTMIFEVMWFGLGEAERRVESRVREAKRDLRQLRMRKAHKVERSSRDV